MSNKYFFDNLEEPSEPVEISVIKIQDDSGETRSVKIPPELPILPLKGIVVFPETAIPLTIGQPRSIRLVDDAVAGAASRLIGLITSKNLETENPLPEDLYQIGTLAVIHRLFRTPEGTIRLLIQGLSRFKVEEYTQSEPYLQAKVQQYPEVIEKDLETEALARSSRDQFEKIASLVSSIPKELVTSIASMIDPLQTVYTISNFQRMELADAQTILETNPVKDKFQKLNAILTKEIEVLELGQKIQNEARTEIDKVQREYFLREQLKAIQRELGEKDETAVDVEEFRKKIEAAQMPAEADKQARLELDRLSRLPTAAAEYGVIRTYLDWLVSLPWSKSTQDNLDIVHAREVLDTDHYGLKDIKERILEFLAVRKLRLERKDELSDQGPKDLIRKQREGVILCFIGPPGVGKTSLGQSIARAMDRKFIRASLGGIRDEAEIRGHRRTYIGALPGRILQSIRRIESRNPVFMLDEIDKLSFDFHGDPASALLEVLDPEQNSEFRDNYLEIAFDLSQVIFITTANQFDTIPLPLIDRMEIIQLSGYTEKEKTIIAQNYLVPRQIKENSLKPGEISFSDEALHTIIQSYTREAGVRNLERKIGGICRKIVTKVSEFGTSVNEITPALVTEYLGKPIFRLDEEIMTRTNIPGVAIGLSVTSFGGEILFIEATKMPGSKGFLITGSIGDVMQESARAAFSYVRSRAEELGFDSNFFDRTDIHLHIPSGAQPKDGPSAGVTIATTLASLLSGRRVKSDVAMTGEITLRGQVLPVGGIKDKVLAAHRAGIKIIILPKQNETDLEELPIEVREAIHFIPVDCVDEVFENSLENNPIQAEEKADRN